MSVGNLKLEQIVLGAIFLDEANYWSIADLLTIDLFSTPDHQKIYAIISELASDGRAIRVPIMSSRIGELSSGQDADAYLSMLLHVASQEEALPLGDYAMELREASTRRKVVELAENMLKSAKDSKLDAQRVVDRASEVLADISRQAALEAETNLSTVFARVAEQAGDRSKVGALRPCLHGLESMVGNFPFGSLVLLGGGPGSGKTALAMQQLLFSSQAHPCSLFELEMEAMALVVRATSGQTGVTMRDMLRGVSEEQFNSILKARRDFEGRKLTIVAPAKMSIQQIRARAFAHKRKFGLDALAVDHVKLIERPSKARMDPVERAYENTRDLKALAKDLNCVVFGLCQFTKAARQKETPEPEMEDFYGGSLEEHADIMLANFNRYDWLERNKPTNNGKMKEKWDQDRLQAAGKIEVFKLKDRFGQARDRKIFDWDGKNTRFVDRGGGTQETLFEEAFA